MIHHRSLLPSQYKHSQRRSWVVIRARVVILAQSLRQPRIHYRIALLLALLLALCLGYTLTLLAHPEAVQPLLSSLL